MVTETVFIIRVLFFIHRDGGQSEDAYTSEVSIKKIDCGVKDVVFPSQSESWKGNIHPDSQLELILFEIVVYRENN